MVQALTGTAGVGARTIAQTLADFACTLRVEDLPEEVRGMLLSLVLDQLACQVAASQLPFNALVRDYALEETPSGRASVIGGAKMARPEWAALANGTAGHGFEMDDSHATALAHPGCVIVPTVLAVGEQIDATGSEALVALALGYEITLRVGLATQPSMVMDRGFHETCFQGVFGAAVAAGRLLGLDPVQMTAALGIAGSHGSGTIEYGRTGGEVKRLHAGLGAMGGIRSAQLARRGLTGPLAIFEGGKGILQAVAQNFNADAILDELGSVWHLSTLYTKKYCCAATVHGPIKALLWVMSEQGLKDSDIDRIVVSVDRFSAHHLGTLGPRPRDMAGAQFSLHYSLAMTAVLGGNGVAEYLHVAAKNFSDPRIARIAENVTVEVSEEFSRQFPQKLIGGVRVVCVDGAVHEASDATSFNWDAEFVTERFRSILGAAYGADSAQSVEAAVVGMRQAGSVRKILAPLGQRSLSS